MDRSAGKNLADQQSGKNESQTPLCPIQFISLCSVDHRFSVKALTRARVVLIRCQLSGRDHFLFKNSRVFRHCSRKSAHQQDGPLVCPATSARGRSKGLFCPAKRPAVHPSARAGYLQAYFCLCP
jgi:ribosomal protein S14